MVLEDMSSTDARMFSDKEWKEVRSAWAESFAATLRLLELLRNDYKPRSRRRKQIQAAIEREELNQKVMLRIIDLLQDMDKILHKEA